MRTRMSRQYADTHVETVCGDACRDSLVSLLPPEAATDASCNCCQLQLLPTSATSLCPHTTLYVGVGIEEQSLLLSAYVSIRQHTSA